MSDEAFDWELQPAAPAKRKWGIWHILIILGLVGFISMRLLGAWGAQQFEVLQVKLPAQSLAQAGPLRMAVIGDTHLNNELFKRAIDEMRLKKPDIIFYVGDLVNASARFQHTRETISLLRELREIAPVVAILGNHDMEKLDQVQRVFQEAKIPLLRNKAVTWTSPKGKKIRIIGLGDWNEGDEKPELCMKARGEEELPVILLSHDPESRWLLDDYDWDLMLSGHTHGGQLGNPFTGEYISFRSSMPAGLFDYDGRQIYVTRGIGAALNMRFFCPAELSIIDIEE